ncbi:MAG: hypothetical protein M1825_004885 [Sarcosagium campestre]|nr:MAG: hypothetical protein M1825_004885 [Sarcosagium campestre]
MAAHQPPNDHIESVHRHQDVYHASTVAEIHAELARLNEEESSVTSRLTALLASQRDVSRELGRLDLLRAQLGTQAVTTRGISHGMLSNAASTANRISGAVRRLDLEQARVKATLEVVEQVAELKACVLGVSGSMGAPQDWEQAAAYLSRASKIPNDIVDGPFAEEMVPTSEVPDAPRITLESAAESLCSLFLREFEKAAKENEGAKVTRFFKLFPLIGRTEVGLDIYGRYVCQGVATRARSNLNAGTGGKQRKDGFFYANALTRLFEHIAQIVDSHGALVERHYGAGRMTRVIERLQVEADVQGGIILDTWSDERNVDRRLTDIKTYAFSFLVQSFLPAQRAAAGTPRANSPANRDAAGGRRTSEEDDTVNMKEVDGLLGEMAVMLGRWSLYSRFIADKCKSSQEESSERDPSNLTMPSVIANSQLAKRVSDRLIAPFNSMTTFFFRRSVEKAFQLDESPSDLSLSLNKAFSTNPPFITSAVDDVMYIVNKILQRSLATSQRTAVAGIVPTIGRILGSDFVVMIQRKMRDESYPKPVVQGGMPPEDKIIAFLVLINNLDVATDYIRRIVQGRLDDQTQEGGTTAAASGDDVAPTPLADLYPFDHDAVFVETQLLSMQHSFESKTSELISDGINVSFDRIVKPRLRPILADAFRDVDYTLTDEELRELRARHEADDPSTHDDHHSIPTAAATAIPPIQEDAVKRRFEHAWTALMKPLRRLLTDRCYEKLLTAAVAYLSGRVLEKRIWSYYGRVNELGAVRLERDIAAVVGAVVRGGRYGLRDAFARCTQICLVMNMEEDEWDEICQGSVNKDNNNNNNNNDTIMGDSATSQSDYAWKIDAEERSRARMMVKEAR